MRTEEQQLLDEYQKTMRESIALGVEAKEFLNSALATHIATIAEGKVLRATDTLKNIDPTNTQGIMEQQMIIKTFEHYAQCLLELVGEGDTAYKMYLMEDPE